MVSTKLRHGMVAVALLCALAFGIWLVAGSVAQTEKTVAKVRIAGLALPGAGLLFIADERGYFREQGLEVELQGHPTGKAALEALYRGEAEFALAGDTPLVFNILAGQKLEILGTVYRPNGGIAVVARKDQAATPAALKGKRLGVTLVSSGQFVADTFLLAQGVDAAAVTMVDLKQTDALAALQDGRIAAASLWQPYLADAQEALGANGVTFSTSGLYTFRLSLVSRDGYAGRNAPTVRKVLTALQQAARFNSEQPEQTLDLLSKRTGIPKPSFKRFYLPAEYDLGLEQGLLLALDDQTRWALKHGYVKAERMPNYLDYLRPEGLTAVSPDAVKLIR